MRDPKQAVGVVVESKTWDGVAFKAEIVEADRTTIRVRVRLNGGDVIENLLSPENPREQYRNHPDGPSLGDSGCVLIRAWLNGEELSEKPAQETNWMDKCLCSVLATLYPDSWTGYAHNYLFRDGVAYEMEEHDMDD